MGQLQGDRVNQIYNGQENISIKRSEKNWNKESFGNIGVQQVNVLAELSKLDLKEEYSLNMEEEEQRGTENQIRINSSYG